MLAETLIFLFKILIAGDIISAITAFIFIFLGFRQKRVLQKYQNVSDIIDNKEIAKMTSKKDKYFAAGLTMFIIAGCILIILAILSPFLLMLYLLYGWHSIG